MNLITQEGASKKKLRKIPAYVERAVSESDSLARPGDVGRQALLNWQNNQLSSIKIYEEIMNTLYPELKSIRKVIDLHIPLRLAGLASALLLVSLTVHGQQIAWPQFRGPDSNPVGANARLAERWLKTENVEWSQEIPGRGWSSPIVTGGKLFCLSEEGQTFVIATGEKFQLLHVNELDDMAQATPALAGERLLIRTEHRLYSIRRRR